MTAAVGPVGLDSSDADNIPRYIDLMIGESLWCSALMFIIGMRITMQHHMRLVAANAHDNRVRNPRGLRLADNVTAKIMGPQKDHDDLRAKAGPSLAGALHRFGDIEARRKDPAASA